MGELTTEEIRALLKFEGGVIRVRSTEFYSGYNVLVELCLGELLSFFGIGATDEEAVRHAWDKYNQHKGVRDAA